MKDWIEQREKPAPKNRRILGYVRKLYNFDLDGWFSGIILYNEKFDCYMFVSDAGGNYYLHDLLFYQLIKNPTKIIDDYADFK